MAPGRLSGADAGFGVEVRGMSYYIVINGQGPAWVAGRPMREQEGWAAHARFVNDLMAEGFILLGGPLRGSSHHRALLMIQSDSEATVRARLAIDPWVVRGILVAQSIEPWEILVSNDRFDPILAQLSGS
jgi:uncharacterized protein YciI